MDSWRSKETDDALLGSRQAPCSYSMSVVGANASWTTRRAYPAKAALDVKIDLERGGVHSDLPLVTSTLNRKRTQTIPDPTQARHGSQMPMPLDEPNYLQGRSSQPSEAVPDEPGPFGKLRGNPLVIRRGP